MQSALGHKIEKQGSFGDRAVISGFAKYKGLNVSIKNWRTQVRTIWILSAFRREKHILF